VTERVFFADRCPEECGGGGLACQLCDVSGYSITTMSAPTASANACTPSQIADASAACFGSSATQQTCDAWQAANALDAGSAGDASGSGCVDCLFTAQSAAAWGALVCTATSCTLNSGGCVDLVLGQTAQEKQSGGIGSCGDLVHERDGCSQYACDACPTTGAPYSDYDTCVQSVATTQCKSYVDKIAYVGPCDPLHGDAAPSAAASCFPQTPADVAKLLGVFCGAGP
jgi:hypothetical protein